MLLSRLISHLLFAIVMRTVPRPLKGWMIEA